ncbi:MAG TPA: DUF4147 domain-containing protein, partial [Candidatus Aquicultoraceae bacterium]|nr:DUF4147 domain-containing protein [Candidatus Aquicultoraceae bacterium]
MDGSARSLLTGIYRAAVASVDPSRLVRAAISADSGRIRLRAGAAGEAIPRARLDRIFLVGGGKAARAMAREAVAVLRGRVAGGAIAVPKGEGGSLGAVRLIESGHPLPDEGSREAAQAMLDA